MPTLLKTFNLTIQRLSTLMLNNVLSINVISKMAIWLLRNLVAATIILYGENGAFPPTRDGCIHSLSMRKRG